MNIMQFIAPIIYLTLAVFLFWTALSFYNASKSFAPFVPCKKRELPRIFEVIGLKNNEVFYDLGCGDGRVVFYAAQHFPVKAIGVEMSFLFFFYCWVKRIFLSDKRNIIFKLRNLFYEDLSKADAIYVYGMPKVLEKRLRYKLEKELKKGARVIAYGFPIKGLEPESIRKPDENHKKSIYLYRF